MMKKVKFTKYGAKYFGTKVNVIYFMITSGDTLPPLLIAESHPTGFPVLPKDFKAVNSIHNKIILKYVK